MRRVQELPLDCYMSIGSKDSESKILNRNPPLDANMPHGRMARQDETNGACYVGISNFSIITSACKFRRQSCPNEAST